MTPDSDRNIGAPDTRQYTAADFAISEDAAVHTLANGLNGTCLQRQSAALEIIVKRAFDDDAFAVFGVVGFCGVKANARQSRILVF